MNPSGPYRPQTHRLRGINQNSAQQRHIWRDGVNPFPYLICTVALDRQSVAAFRRILTHYKLDLIYKLTSLWYNFSPQSNIFVYCEILRHTARQTPLQSPYLHIMVSASVSITKDWRSSSNERNQTGHIASSKHSDRDAMCARPRASVKKKTHAADRPQLRLRIGHDE